MGRLPFGVLEGFLMLQARHQALREIAWVYVHTSSHACATPLFSLSSSLAPSLSFSLLFLLFLHLPCRVVEQHECKKERMKEKGRKKDFPLVVLVDSSARKAGI